MNDLNFKRTAEFKKECEKLSKRKCKTLPDDLEVLKKAMRVKIPEHPSTKRINNLGDSVKVPIYKVKQFRCKHIKKGARSGFRLIYAYISDSSTVIFVEMYHKNHKEVEDRKRIYDYFSEED